MPKPFEKNPAKVLLSIERDYELPDIFREQPLDLPGQAGPCIRTCFQPDNHPELTYIFSVAQDINLINYWASYNGAVK